MTSTWSEHYTKDGRVYYYNRKTKQSAWEKPTDFDGEPAVAPVTGDGATKTTATPGGGVEWEELWDPKNERHYYYHRPTRKTQWQRPEDVEIKSYTGGAAVAHKDTKRDKHKKVSVTSATVTTTPANTSSTTAAPETTLEAKGSVDGRIKGVTIAADDSPREDGVRRTRDTASTPTKKKGSSPSPRGKHGERRGRASGRSTENDANVATGSVARRALEVEAEDVDAGDDGDDFVEQDEALMRQKRKKGAKNERPSTSSSGWKKPRKDDEKRMIICDEEENLPAHNNVTGIGEEDTEDGKEAARLLQAMSKTDAIMEANVLNLINGFLRAHTDSNGPEMLVEKLSTSYRGHAQMIGLVASWLDGLPVSKTALEHKITFDASDDLAAQSNGASWEPASNILYSQLKDVVTQHYEPALVSNVLSGSATEPEWLSDMLRDRNWRMMLIELAETHKSCNLLQYAIRRISEAGHHKEIASISNANAFFTVFNGILLDAFCRIPFASDEDAGEDLSALKKISCHSAYSYVYAEELLCAIDSNLHKLQSDHGKSGNDRAHYRSVRSKLCRVRFDLQETAIEKFGAKIEAFHPLRRRYLNDANKKLSDAILSIVRNKKCTEAAADILAKEFRSGSKTPPVANLRDPLVFRSLLDPLFNTAETVSPAFAQNCIDLLAYASCAKDERSILDSALKISSVSVGLDSEEMERTKLAVKEASTICRSDHTLSYNMNQTGVVEKLLAVMVVPLASMGVLHWLQATLTSPTFFNSSLLHICFPSLLRILKGSIKLHVAQWPIAFQVLVTSLRLHPEVNPVKALELKRESLRSMVFMITCGYVLPVLRFVYTNTVELDQALLRNFITALFEQIAPPYSAKFVIALTRILTHPKVQNAIKSCPLECKTKLRGFVSYCKKNPGVLPTDQLQALMIAQDGL